MSAGEAQDENLTDDALESEIELVSELVVAATSSDGPLPQHEVDLLLGVSPGQVSPGQVSPGDDRPVPEGDTASPRS